MTKFAVLVGCNYQNNKQISPLFGCHNDVKKIKNLLIARLGFDAGNITVLTDEHRSALVPTGANIKEILYRMAHNASAGDTLFFYFSGHGYFEDTIVEENCTREECIVPADFNLIFSCDFQHICSFVPPGAAFTVLSDSCHSGGLIYTGKEQIGPGISPYVCLPLADNNDQDNNDQDNNDQDNNDQDNNDQDNNGQGRKVRLLPYRSLVGYLKSQTGMESSDIGTHILEMFKYKASHRFRRTQRDNWTVDGGILISACESNQYAQEAEDEGGNPCGAFTKAVAQCLINGGTGVSLTTNRELVETARKNLKDCQSPCLYCTDDNVDAVFLGGDARNSTGWKCLSCLNFLPNMFNNLFTWGRSDAGN